MRRNLVELTINSEGIIPDAVPIEDPKILNFFRGDELATTKTIITHAPRRANAYVIGTIHPRHLDYYPVQYYRIMAPTARTRKQMHYKKREGIHFNTDTISDFEGHPQNRD